MILVCCFVFVAVTCSIGSLQSQNSWLTFDFSFFDVVETNGFHFLLLMN